MSVRLFSAAITGIDAQLIEVEVDSTPGLHAFSIVGLPDKAVQESKERIASAIRANRLAPPSAKHKKIIINLAPADIRKEGPSYDLPIAVGYLLETRQVSFQTSDKLFLGELSLDGSVKAVNGVLSAALMARNAGFKEIFVPAANQAEAAVVEGVSIFGVSSITAVISHLSGKLLITPAERTLLPSLEDEQGGGDSFRMIKGQYAAKRALIVAASGGHNLLMSGPPGTGKTLLAKSLMDLLPPLLFSEAIEVARIYSALGLLKNGVFPHQRPFRNPHHTASAAAIVGGGSSPRPGEISLAHRGVLFLDELPEFSRNVLEGLREPLEEGMITVSRAAGSVRLPAKSMLIGAMNPCPCGNLGNSSEECVCSPINITRYRKKISGPLLDRIDIQVLVPRETSLFEKTNDLMPLEEFKKVRHLVAAARAIQEKRFLGTDILNNAEISYKNIDLFCILTPSAESLLRQFISAKNVSLRTYHKIKKIGRTIADLDASQYVGEKHIAEAMSLKINEKVASGAV
ncbi:MAG TPA: YifB family Mg chelatase-like AAA ATPase [Candidatus Paceibacterota bacterium]|nr:YifB family Mg chelatase-like AAA ATPase [Candidatus Paceibacterota bacterium]